MCSTTDEEPERDETMLVMQMMMICMYVCVRCEAVVDVGVNAE